MEWWYVRGKGNRVERTDTEQCKCKTHRVIYALRKEKKSGGNEEKQRDMGRNKGIRFKLSYTYQNIDIL